MPDEPEPRPRATPDEVLDWAVRTHRIIASSRAFYAERIKTDHAIDPALRLLTPIPEALRPAEALRPVSASAA
jgi:hypothetical protein